MAKPRMFLISLENHEDGGHHVVDHINTELRTVFPRDPLSVQEIQDDHLIPSLPVATPTASVHSHRIMVRLDSALRTSELRDRVIKALGTAGLDVTTAHFLHEDEVVVDKADLGNLTDFDCQQRGQAAFYREIEFDPVGGTTPTDPKLTPEEKLRYCLPETASDGQLRAWRTGWLYAAGRCSGG